MNGENAWCYGQQSYRDEILERIESQLVEQTNCCGNICRCKEHCVAIRGGFCRESGSDCSAGSTTVLDHQLLSQVFAHLGSDDSGHGIRATAGGEWHDETNWLRRIGLSMRF